MKTNFPVWRLVSAALAAHFLLAAGTGCAKKESPDLTTRVKDAYEDAKTTVADAWKDVKSYSFEKRKEFSASATAMKSTMDSQVDKLRSGYSDAKASASRKAAMDELKSAQTDFKVKVEALERATADTWDRAKQEAVSAWDRLEAAYKKARED